MDRIISIADLIGTPPKNGKPGTPGILPVSRTTLWRWIDHGEFPKPLRLGERRVGFRESDVHRWLAERDPEHGAGAEG